MRVRVRVRVRYTTTERGARLPCASTGLEFVVAMIVLLLILAVMGLALLAGIIALVLWMARRTQANTNPTVGNETPAPPQ